MCKSELMVTWLFNTILSNTFPNFAIFLSGIMVFKCCSGTQKFQIFLLNYLWVDFKRKVLTALQKSLTASRSTAVIACASPADLFSTRINQNLSLRRGNENREMWGWFKPNWTLISSEEWRLFIIALENVKRHVSEEDKERKIQFCRITSQFSQIWPALRIYCLFLKFSLVIPYQEIVEESATLSTQSLLPLGSNGFPMP